MEAGLAFAIDWSKSFLSRDALLKQKREGVKRRLVILVLEDAESVLWGGEPIHRNGKPVGYTTSSSYGHSVSGAVAMGYVNDPNGVDEVGIHFNQGHYEINVAGTLCSARAFLRAPMIPSASAFSET